MMKKLLSTLALTGVLVVAMTGCASRESLDEQARSERESSENFDGAYQEHFVFQQEMPDGSFVNCVWAKENSAGGLSCDFNNPVGEFGNE